MEIRMKTKLRRRLGISTVITTIIILVASVVLAASIVLYSGSLIQSQTAIEGITITGVKLFVHDNANGRSQYGQRAGRKQRLRTKQESQI